MTPIKVSSPLYRSKKDIAKELRMQKKEKLLEKKDRLFVAALTIGQHSCKGKNGLNHFSLLSENSVSELSKRPTVDFGRMLSQKFGSDQE